MAVSISTVPPSSLTTYNDCLREVRSCLSQLKELAKVTNFDNVDESKQFADNVAYMKMFLARAERISRDA